MAGRYYSQLMRLRPTPTSRPVVVEYRPTVPMEIRERRHMTFHIEPTDTVGLVLPGIKEHFGLARGLQTGPDRGVWDGYVDSVHLEDPLSATVLPPASTVLAWAASANGQPLLLTRS